MSSELDQRFIDQLRTIVGDDGVIANADELKVYECDAYTLEKFAPEVVTLPRTTEEVAAIVKLCAAHNVAFIPRGAGTSLSGAVLAVGGGVVIAVTRMTKILNVDFTNRREPAERELQRILGLAQSKRGPDALLTRTAGFS